MLARIGPYNIKEARIKIQAHIPNTIAIFKKANKGCRDMYNILISKRKETIKAVYKWHEEGYRFNESDWGKIFELPFKTTKESKYHWLQFQILHRIIATNYFLTK